MHQLHSPSELTPYQVLGELVRVRAEGCSSIHIELEGADQWSPQELNERRKLLKELCERLTKIGRPALHPWYCVGLDSVLPTQLDRITQRIAGLKVRLEGLAAEQNNLAGLLELSPPATFRGFEKLLALTQRLASAPHGLNEAAGCEEWDRSRDEIGELLKTGERHAHLTSELIERVRPAAWTADVRDVRRVMGTLPAHLTVGPTRIASGFHVNCRLALA